MRLRRAGAGSPTILLDGEWGHWSPIWARVQPKLAERFATLSFDRMGLGGSDPAGPDRSPFQIIDELEAALAAAQLDGPIVYVGHGAAGVHARTLAHRDARVVGLVLVDPVVEALGVSKPFRRLRDEFAMDLLRAMTLARLHMLGPISVIFRRRPFVRRLPKDAARELRRGYTTDAIQTILAELGGLDDAMKVLATIGIPKIPYEILSAADDWLPGDRDGRSKETPVQTMHRKLAESSKLGAWSIVPKTTHNVHVDRPDAVVDSIVRIASR